MSPRINYGLCVTMMCQSRFISLNEYTPLVRDTDGGNGMQEHSELPTQFCYEPKAALKNKVY